MSKIVNNKFKNSLLQLDHQNISDINDSGFYGTYTDIVEKYTGLFRDGTDGVYKLFTELEERPTNTINIGGTGFEYANLLLNNSLINNYIQFSDIATPSNPSNGEGRLYKKTGNDGLFWLPDSGGSEIDLTALNPGNVSGPGSSTNNAIVVWDGTTGDLLKNSSILINSNNISNLNEITFNGITGNNNINFPSNITDALTLTDGSLDYVTFQSTTASEKIIIKQDLCLEGNLEFSNGGYLELLDIAEPSNPFDGSGRLYKKTGNDGLWWKPDSGGVEVDVSLGGEVDTQSANATTQTSTSSTSYVDMADITLTTSNTIDKEYLCIFSAEFESSFSGRDIYVIINVDGIDQPNSERRENYSNANQFQNLVTIFKTNAIGNGIVIKVRYHYENNKQLKVNARSLIIEGTS